VSWLARYIIAEDPDYFLTKGVVGSRENERAAKLKKNTPGHTYGTYGMENLNIGGQARL
jgi:hypothetical protein